MKSAMGYQPNDEKQLDALVAMDSPKAIIEEVNYILCLISNDFNTVPIDAAFQTVLDLFNGDYPGYRSCNTEYHDFHHTNYVFLAMARLIHGAMTDGEGFTPHQITLGLMAALFHDSGYVQESDDTSGTGAKYTAIHVERSMDLFKDYGHQIGLEEEAIGQAQAVIMCTNLSVDMATIRFPSEKTHRMGQLMGTADVLAQMADRTYLEKLLFLYHEIKESCIGGFSGEVDLLRKTIDFYDFIARRLESSLGGVDRFMKRHFQARWNIDRDLYHIAIEKQRKYLQHILNIPHSDPRDHLKRGGIVDRITNKYAVNA